MTRLLLAGGRGEGEEKEKRKPTSSFCRNVAFSFFSVNLEIGFNLP